MEKLAKGLLNMALDAINDGNRRPNEDNDDRREEHSRATWAEVASEDQDPCDNRRRYPEQGEWDTAGRKESKQSYNVQSSTYEQQGQWETVGRKENKQSHKIEKDQWKGFQAAPNRQQYADEYRGDLRLDPSTEELNDISKACNKLWQLDTNMLTPGKDYKLDIGEGKRVSQRGDMSQQNFFQWINEDVLRKPTFSRFCSLLDNYNPNEGHKEQVSEQEQQEETAFIEEISRTAIMKYLHKYLAAKRVVSGDPSDFKAAIKSLWFDLYGRGGTSGASSAFEHVFVGEIKNKGEQQVSGFHNWLQFYLQEAKGKVDYHGHIFPRRRSDIVDEDSQLLTIQFEWNGVLKSVSSTLIGVSPELEVALYTLCFYCGNEDNFVDLGPYPVNIKCYRLGNRIGSAFPIAES